jgi:N-methylhydantoinase A
MAITDIRLAADIGGTFTDLALSLPDRLETAKHLTTSDAPERGVLDGVRELIARTGINPRDIKAMIHGTTLATNALIERRGARTALIVTQGLRDSVEMAQENRFAQYDISQNRPAPLVPRHLRWEVLERLNWRGEVLTPLDMDTVKALLPQIESDGIESLAIGLIHAYANGDHEQRIAEVFQTAYPNLSISLSSEVCPEVREYERQSTTCANAYVQPVMDGYLGRLRAGLNDMGVGCDLLMMSSGGTLMGLDAARRYPIRLVESGPAGGAILAAQIAQEESLDRVISFDMGGTTAKICLIDDAQPLTSRSFEVARAYRFMRGSGLPVRIPVIEMVEIGAGGGSLAQVDQLGRITVGPRSAGSEPGPACYGRGGTHPAVTDADLLLGKLDAESFAGGTFKLDTNSAVAAMREHVGEPLSLEPHDAALGVLEVVDENMASAARMHAVEWGSQVDGRVIIAFGGAAPLHAARLAQKLGIESIVVPSGAGVGSAIGFLRAPVAYEVVRSRYALLSNLVPGIVKSVVDEMRIEALELVRVAEPDAELTEKRLAYMRYAGQGHEIAVSVDESSDGEALRDAFEASYTKLFGRTIPNLDIEVLSWTLSLSAPSVENNWAAPALPAGRPEPNGTRRLLDADTGQWTEAPVFSRHDISPQHRVEGPALVEEDQTTTVVPAGFSVSASQKGHLLIQRSAR